MFLLTNMLSEFFKHCLLGLPISGHHVKKTTKFGQLHINLIALNAKVDHAPLLTRQKKSEVWIATPKVFY